MKLVLIFTFITILFYGCSSGLVLEDPTLESTQPTMEEEQLIAEGLSLHDQGRYREAIDKYEQVISENPNNGLALYEAAYSYLSLGDYKTSLEICQEAIKFDTDFLGLVYVLYATNLEYLGRPEDAVTVYLKGMELFPDLYLLPYNLAITYGAMGKDQEKMNYLRQTLRLNPDHTSSNLVLGGMYYDNDLRIPAILALSKFLVLEPNSQRSSVALDLLKELLAYGVEVESDGNINLTYRDNSSPRDGDFSTVDLGLSMSRAQRYTDQGEGKSEMQLVTGDFTVLFQLVNSIYEKDPSEGFVWVQYVPYFGEMSENDFTEPFTYFIFQVSGDREVLSWLEENENRVNDFLDWSSNYMYAN